MRLKSNGFNFHHLIGCHIDLKSCLTDYTRYQELLYSNWLFLNLTGKERTALKAMQSNELARSNGLLYLKFKHGGDGH